MQVDNQRKTKKSPLGSRNSSSGLKEGVLTYKKIFSKHMVILINIGNGQLELNKTIDQTEEK